MFFDFLGMMGNYDDRKVDRYEANGLLVSTCSVTDSSQPYETAVRHKNYNNDKIIIVEQYDTKQQAQIGHDKWVSTMTAENLPESIKDVGNCEIVQFAKELGIDLNKECIKE